MILEGSTGGLTSAMHAGEQAVHGFEHTVEHVGGHVAELLAALGVGFTLEGVAEYLKGTFEAIAANAKLSDSLGISTESLGRLQYAAKSSGVANEQLENGLKKMLKGLNEAQSGSGKAAEAFAQLGLNAKTLVNESPEKAFAQIGDRLKEIKNPAERMGATLEIFGRQGSSLIPVLTQGSEKLGEMGGEADKFGLSLSRVDAAQIELAHESIVKVEGALEGAANQLVVHMAPYIEAVANKLVDLGTSGQGAASFITNGFESVVKAVAYATDFLNAFKAGWEVLRGVTASVIGEIIDDIGLVIQGVEWLSNKLTGSSSHMGEGFRQFGEAVKETGRDAFKAAGEDWDKFIAGDNSKAANRMFRSLEEDSHKAAAAIAADKSKIGGAFDDMAENAKKLEAVTKKLAELHKQVDEFGKTKGQKAADDIAAAGGTAAQQAEAQHLADQLDRMEEMKKAQEEMAKDAAKMWEETRTPAEKYANEVDKINTLLKEGKIDQDTANRDKNKAEAKLAKENEGRSPHLLEVGSQDAAKFVAEVQQRQRGEETARKIAANTEKSTDYLKQIADYFTGGGDQNEFVGISIT